MKKTRGNKLYTISAFSLCLALCSGLFSQGMEIPRSAAIIHVGMNALQMQPRQDSAISNFRLKVPGLYLKVTGENYYSATSFMAVDLNLSFNYGWMKDGYARTSRLAFEYGIGKRFDHVKFTLSPGLCYASMAYQNDASEKGITETRFAPSLSAQTDLILYSDTYNYLGLFLELSAMINKPSRMVNQAAFGIAWKPVFKRRPVEPVAIPGS